MAEKKNRAVVVVSLNLTPIQASNGTKKIMKTNTKHAPPDFVRLKKKLLCDLRKSIA